MSETYDQIEARILEALSVHENLPDHPISTLAHEFNVLYPLLYARLNGRQSRIDRPTTIKKLTFDMEEGLVSIYAIWTVLEPLPGFLC